MRVLQIGYVPLTDAATLLVARRLGLFETHGLDVSLSREVAWATVRDKIAHGALDASHMLAPMALASTAGIDDAPRPVLAISALAANGSSFAFATALSDQMTEQAQGASDPQALGRALRHLLDQRRASGGAPIALARVFPYSIHNYLLAYWLETAGIDAMADVRSLIVPPSRMSEYFAAGQIEGCAVGAPWSDVAEQAGLARKLIRACDLWPDGPDKVLGMRAERALQIGDGVERLQSAIEAAARWCDDPDNRPALLEILQSGDGLGLASGAMTPALQNEIRFVAAPRLAHGTWMARQMGRWGHLQPMTDFQELATRVYDHGFVRDRDELTRPVAPLFDEASTL